MRTLLFAALLVVSLGGFSQVDTTVHVGDVRLEVSQDLVYRVCEVEEDGSWVLYEFPSYKWVKRLVRAHKRKRYSRVYLLCLFDEWIINSN